jgi:FkbM family methyltransferase
MPLIVRIPALRGRVMSVSLSTGPFFFSDRSELVALSEVHVEGEYAANLPADPRVIVDLGANAGQASRYFRGLFPDALIVAVEPDPGTFEKLRRNVAGDPRIRVRQAAITTANGDVVLEQFDAASWASRISHSGAGITVPGITLDQLFHEEGLDRVDLMKVDIEGLEVAVLGTSSAASRVEAVVGELHGYVDMPEAEALAAMRNGGHFSRAEFTQPRIFWLLR